MVADGAVEVPPQVSLTRSARPPPLLGRGGACLFNLATHELGLIRLFFFYYGDQVALGRFHHPDALHKIIQNQRHLLVLDEPVAGNDLFEPLSNLDFVVLVAKSQYNIGSIMPAQSDAWEPGQTRG